MKTATSRTQWFLRIMKSTHIFDSYSEGSYHERRCHKENYFPSETRLLCLKKLNICMNGQKEKLRPMLQKQHVTMNEEKELMLKPLMKRVMQIWLPASDALLEMIIFHLPLPAKAQKYRVENLYVGLLDDLHTNAIRSCDPEGLLMLYV